MSAPTATKEPTVVELIAGVASGARDLAAAHSAQMKAELASEMARARSASILLAIGSVFSMIGLGFMLVALVDVLTVQAQWPAWAAWLAVGGGATMIGGTLLAVGLPKLKSVRRMPTRSLQSIRESLQWISNN